MPDRQVSAEGLNYAFNKISNFLALKEEEKAGLTVLITNHWILVALVEQPYYKTASQMPCFLDGFAYAGYFRI
jgi:hypothetical protein